jgi:hypothetical protein
MIYGYARVSTAAQDESGQVKQQKAARCEKVFREKINGTTTDRPQLGNVYAEGFSTPWRLRSQLQHCPQSLIDRLQVCCGDLAAVASQPASIDGAHLIA